MFRDYDETVRHGDHLPCVTDGSVDSRLPPEPRIVALPCRLSSDFTLHDQTDSAASLTARDSQQVGASPSHNIGTDEQPEAVCGACLGTGQHAHFMGLCSHCGGTGKVAPPPAPKPGVSELVHAAIHDTDFLGDLTDDQHLLCAAVENAVDMAADAWSDAHDGEPVPLDTIILARAALLAEAQDMLVDRAEAAADALLDAMEAGDLDHDGAAISYPRYHGV
jgi:hypothetical protein